MPDPLKAKVELPPVEAPVASPEESSVEADFKAIEAEPEAENFLEEEEESVKTETPAQEQAQPTTATAAAPAATVPQKDEVTIEVEKVLEEGLGELYKTLPPSAQAKFKQKGEEASNEISKMVRSLQMNVKHALQLIRDWLLTIPKVNKFFLEQEAKIKVDKINLLIDARKQDSLKLP